MKFKRFELHAKPFLSEAYCECGEYLREVPDGWISIAMFCPKCKNLYQLELRKIPRKKVDQGFISACMKKLNIGE